MLSCAVGLGRIKNPKARSDAMTEARCLRASSKNRRSAQAKSFAASSLTGTTLSPTSRVAESNRQQLLQRHESRQGGVLLPKYHACRTRPSRAPSSTRYLSPATDRAGRERQTMLIRESSFATALSVDMTFTPKPEGPGYSSANAIHPTPLPVVVCPPDQGNA